MGIFGIEVVRAIHDVLIDVFRSTGSPPVKKEKSEEREKVTPNGKSSKKEKSPVKSDSKTSKVRKSPKSQKKSPSKSPKSTKKSPTAAKTSPKETLKLVKRESTGKSTEKDVDMKDIEKTDVESKNDASGEKEVTPKKEDKPINPFFLPKKEIKVQSAGAGLKGADYSPDKTKYHPIKDAFWSHGEK